MRDISNAVENVIIFEVIMVRWISPGVWIQIETLLFKRDWETRRKALELETILESLRY